MDFKDVILDFFVNGQDSKAMPIENLPEAAQHIVSE